MPHIIARAPGDIANRLWTLYWLARMLCREPGSPRRLVELGTRQGDSTRALLAACEDEHALLNSFDMEDCSVIYLWRSFLPLWAFRQKNSVLAGEQWWPEIKVDLVFVDTDHTFETTQREIEVWHRHVRPGGVMMFHDYWLLEPGRDGVKPAVDQFYGANKDGWRLETHDAYNDTGLGLLWHH